MSEIVDLPDPYEKYPAESMPRVVLIRRLVSIAVVIACELARLVRPGWYFLTMFRPYLGICLAHFLVHWKAARIPLRSARIPIGISHLLLVAGFLLQWDVGDGASEADGWLTVTALFSFGANSKVPSWWWGHPTTMNYAVFLPVLISWVVLVVMIKKPHHG